MKHHEHFNHSRRGNAAVIILMIVVGAIVIGLSYFSAVQTGSNERVENSRYTNEINGDLAQKFKKDSEKAERDFNSLQEYKKDKITMEDIDIYEKAVSDYEKYLAYSGVNRSANVRADKMRKRLHDLRAMLIRERTLTLESEGDELVNAGKFSEAEKKFREAYGLEKRIDTQYALADLRSSARTQVLFYRMQAMQAIPMTARGERLEKEGDEAFDEKNWTRAGLKYRESVKIFQRLNNEFAMVSFDNGTSVARLNRKIDTVSSSPYQERINGYSAAAKEFENTGNWEEALREREKALAEYELLATNFPRSNYVSDEEKKALVAAAADTAVFPQYQKLDALVDKLQDALRNGDHDNAATLARNAAVFSQSIARDFPNTTVIPENLVQTLAFIDISSAVLEQINATVKNSLKKIPGVPAEERLMLDKETAQALYQAVTKKNPAADSENPLAPVESVSFFDARHFCRLLSVLCGYEVRLPLLEEYLAARGEKLPEESALPEQAWVMENSGGKMHAVGTLAANENGFFDLFGNVSEWLGDELNDTAGTINPDSGETNAYAAGGDYLSPSEYLLAEPVYKAPKNDRSRQRGFRFVVDFTKQTNLRETKID